METSSNHAPEGDGTHGQDSYWDEMLEDFAEAAKDTFGDSHSQGPDLSEQDMFEIMHPWLYPEKGEPLGEFELSEPREQDSASEPQPPRPDAPPAEGS